MGTDSGIDWTTHTFNIWRGCSVVPTRNSGCFACYARTQWEYNHRQSGPDGKPGPKFTRWGVSGKGMRRPNTSTWDNPKHWNRTAIAAGRRDRVFTASIADVFDDHEDIDKNGWRARLWRTIWETREGLDWLLLTKRPESIARFLPPESATVEADGYPPWGAKGWPHVWLGVSVEHQDAANQRIPHLLSVPAAIHWLSCEPLVEGPLDLRPWLSRRRENGGRRVSWVVVGGESCSSERHTPRYFDPDWARDLLRQCQEAKPSKAAFFFKQHGNWGPGPDGKPFDYGLNGYGPDSEAVSGGKVVKVFGDGKKLDGALHHNWPRSRMKIPKPSRKVGRPMRKRELKNPEALAVSRYDRAARKIKSVSDIKLADEILTRLRAVQEGGWTAKAGRRPKERKEMRTEVFALIRLLKAAMAPALIGCKASSQEKVAEAEAREKLSASDIE